MYPDWLQNILFWNVIFTPLMHNSSKVVLIALWEMFLTVSLIIFGAKICTDICPRTLSVPRSEQFSESEGYCVNYPSTIFSQGCISGDLFWKVLNIKVLLSVLKILLGTGHKVTGGGGGGGGPWIFFLLVLVFSGPPLSYLTKLGQPTPGVAQKNLAAHPPTKISNVDGYVGNISLPL